MIDATKGTGTKMSIMLCSLVLNEMEWLPALYEQHRNWPGLAAWVFVEGADPEYERVNPGMVRDGLSVDGTSAFLDQIAGWDHRVSRYRYSFAGEWPGDKAQAKCELRNMYMEIAEDVRPDYLVILDADEFYTQRDQERIEGLMEQHPEHNGFIFRYRHPWKPPECPWGLFEKEIMGGFWSIPHCHGWRWESGMRYSVNHMTPRPDPKMIRMPASGPQCIHMAFASAAQGRRAKHEYYRARGEAGSERRNWYVESRSAWETWTPEQTHLVLEDGNGRRHIASMIDYKGYIPEVFQGTV